MRFLFDFWDFQAFQGFQGFLPDFQEFAWISILLCQWENGELSRLEHLGKPFEVLEILKIHMQSLKPQKSGRNPENTSTNRKIREKSVNFLGFLGLHLYFQNLWRIFLWISGIALVFSEFGEFQGFFMGFGTIRNAENPLFPHVFTLSFNN